MTVFIHICKYLILFLVTLTMATAHSSENTMKEIKYRGGVVKFFVPKHWVENYETDGGGMFYEDSQNTGTLRLNLITAKPPVPLTNDAAFKALSTIKNVNLESIKRQQNGNAIASRVEHSTEQGQPITLYWWHVANPVSPSHIRIANFSYTVLTIQENNLKTKTEIQMLANSIRSTTFHSILEKSP